MTPYDKSFVAESVQKVKNGEKHLEFRPPVASAVSVSKIKDKHLDAFTASKVIVWLPHVLWHNVGHPGNCPPCPRCGFESERKTLKMAPPRYLFHLFSIIYTQIVRVFFQRGNCIF